MAVTPLTNGYNVIINQKIGNTNTPIYPFTRTANVKDVAGNTLDAIIATLATKDYVDGETYLTAASTSNAGIVQLYSGTDSESETMAASAKAAHDLNAAIQSLNTAISNDFVAKTQLGTATTTGEGAFTGVATLDTNGKVPSAQLPSYVDDVIEVEITRDGEGAITGALDGKSAAVTGESGKIYVDVLGASPSNNTFRWSGSAFVEISESLALGETASTAFDGARGLTAYNHSQATHARVDATKVESIDWATEADTYNGYIKVWTRDAESATYVKVYDAPALTSSDVTTALGYTPQNSETLATASQNGVMSSAYAAKLDNTLEGAVSQQAPTFTGTGIWYEIVGIDA